MFECNEQALKNGYKYFSLDNPLGENKAKCYGGNTDPGTALYTSTTCDNINMSVSEGCHRLGSAKQTAIYKTVPIASFPNDILLNASSSDNWSFASVEGDNITIQNSSNDPTDISIFYTKNMKGSGNILTDYDHGDMANGGNIKNYLVSPGSTLNVACNNNNMGTDPFPGFKKVCYKKHNSITTIGRYIKIVSALKSGCVNWANMYVYGKSENKNLAEGSTVYMSSTYNSNLYPGQNLVDNNINTFAHTSCSSNDPYGWMMVDLGNDVPIHKIIMASRQDCCSDRGIGSKIIIYSDDNQVVYTSNGFSRTDNSNESLTNDPGGSSKNSYKYYIITPPEKSVIGTNNIDFNGDQMMEHFDGNKQTNDLITTILYVILALIVI